MTLLNPPALALSLFAVPIILLYVLKLRRRQMDLSSVLLWRRSLDDVQANAPWQRLRPNLLLLLQLLALFALVAVLAQPAYTGAHAVAGDLVVIVDESYGMQARDVRPSRFAVALRRAHHLANELSTGHVVSVIGMSAQPRLAVAGSADSGAIARGVDSVRAGLSPPNFLAALSLAASLARNGENTRAVVLTSRQSGISTLPFAPPFSVEIERIGGKLRDLGITAFSAANGAGPRSGTGAIVNVGHTQALVRVSNFGFAPAASDVDLYVNGQLADVRPIRVNPGKEQTVLWANLPAAVHYLTCRVTAADDVTTDKSAWAVVPAPSIRRVLLVSNGNLFLRNALAAIPSVRITQIKPADFLPPSAQSFDVTVFDGVLPRVSTGGKWEVPTLLVGPGIGSIGSLRIGSWMRASGMAPVRVASANPLANVLSGLDLTDVHIARARRIRLPGWMQPLATTGRGAPLVAAGDDGSSRLAIIAFRLQESDWPLRVSFPVVVQNLVQYLAPGLSFGVTSVTPGQAVKFFPRASAGDIQVTVPGGRIETVRPPYPPFTDTSLPGIYAVREGESGRPRGVRPHGATASFTVNFFPAQSAPVAGQAVQHMGRQGVRSLRPVRVLTDVEWIFWLLAMLILTGEWWFAFRH